MADADDSKRCPECESENLKFVSSRDVRNPRSGPDSPILAQTITIQCRRCKASWTITRRTTK